MPISVDWPSRVITIPQADLTPLGGNLYELDIDAFRLELRALEDDSDGISFLATHTHNPPFIVGGIELARTVQIINNYTVTFEDGQYAVNLVGGNTNVADVANINQVSIRPQNSAGLVSIGSGLSPTQSAQLANALAILTAIDPRVQAIQDDTADMQPRVVAMDTRTAQIETDVQTLLTAVNSGTLTAQQAADLTRILQLLEADEVKTGASLQKLQAGTATVLLNKTVTGAGVSNTDVIEIRQA